MNPSQWKTQTVGPLVAVTWTRPSVETAQPFSFLPHPPPLGYIQVVSFIKDTIFITNRSFRFVVFFLLTLLLLFQTKLTPTLESVLSPTSRPSWHNTSQHLQSPLTYPCSPPVNAPQRMSKALSQSVHHWTYLLRSRSMFWALLRMRASLTSFLLVTWNSWPWICPSDTCFVQRHWPTYLEQDIKGIWWKKKVSVWMYYFYVSYPGWCDGMTLRYVEEVLPNHSMLE